MSSKGRFAQISALNEALLYAAEKGVLSEDELAENRSSGVSNESFTSIVLKNGTASLERYPEELKEIAPANIFDDADRRVMNSMREYNYVCI